MAGRVVVYGGRGALGSAIVSRFKETGYWVASIDTRLSDCSDENILVEGETWQQQTDLVTAGLSQLLGEEKLDAVICVAGGWAGGSPASKDFIKNSEAMWKSSVWPASISASLATSHLKEGGLVVLPGAAPATSATPTMAGYGMAKVCVFTEAHINLLILLSILVIITGSSSPVDLQPGCPRLWSATQLSSSGPAARHSGHSHEQEVDGQS